MEPTLEDKLLRIVPELTNDELLKLKALIANECVNAIKISHGIPPTHDSTLEERVLA